MEPTVRIPSAAPSHVRVPPELEGLRRLAYNLYWSWHPQARALYARINGGVWARIHSPIPVLTSMVDWPGIGLWTRAQTPPLIRANRARACGCQDQ